MRTLIRIIKIPTLRLTHTERQASVACEASDLSNLSGGDLECQVKHHHRLALVTLPLPLMLTLDVPLAARCGYNLKANHCLKTHTSLV